MNDTSAPQATETARESPHSRILATEHAANQETPWGLVQLFFGYRFLLALSLSILTYSGWGPEFLGQHHPQLYASVVVLYLGLVLGGGLLLYWRTPSGTVQAAMMIAVDIASITLMLYASGGIQTGLGTLLAVSIAAGSLLIPGPQALAFAAIATLSILAEQTMLHFTTSTIGTSYPHAGLLGISFFAIAILAHVLALRLQRSQQIVSQQELDLANLEQLNDYVIQHMQTGILVVDERQRIRLINEAAWYLLGIPATKAGHSLRQACPALFDRWRHWQQASQQEIRTFQPTPNGRELKAGFSRLGKSGNGSSVIFIEDAAAMTQHAQQMKLASLGRLTASIAHEIRNPLGAIGHAGQLLQESPDIPSGEQRLIEIIGNNTRRVNEIIENVLQLSRRKQAQPREFELRPWLQGFADEFCPAHGISRARFSIAIDPADTQIFADSTQLWQIVNNLCENSVAHFDRDQEELDIQIRGGITRASGGPFIELTDNGPGIPAEVARQIFEPFFTTGKVGTGLGLYIARELSESNRIHLEYAPVASGGSSFRMSFPGVRREKPDG